MATDIAPETMRRALEDFTDRVAADVLRGQGFTPPSIRRMPFTEVVDWVRSLYPELYSPLSAATESSP